MRGIKRWLFLNPRYTELLRWKTVVGTEPLPLGPRLNATAHRLRMPFLRTMAELGRRYQSIGWWVSRLSERNPMVSPLFLRCCYLVTALELLRESEEDLLIVSDSAALLDSIAREARASGWKVERRGEAEEVHNAFQSLLRIAVFTWRWMRRTRGSAARVDGILLRTWLDESSFGGDGTLHDRYFTKLSSWLQARGHRVTIMPVLMNLRRSEREAWRWLAASGRNILDRWTLHGAGDVARAIMACASQLRIRFQSVHIAEIDATALFEEERQRSLFDTGSLDAALWYTLPKRLAKRGDRVTLFLDLFENMITEKPLLAGFREFMPSTRIVAFQHAVPAPLLVSIFVPAEEVDFAPLPDRILTNGSFFTRVLVDAGLPAALAGEAPALRYEYIHEMNDAVHGDGVLVPLPLPLDDAVELLAKVHAALSADSTIPVLVKPHPMSDLSDVLRTAGIDGVPAHWTIASGDMKSALRRAKVVVTLGSSTAFEAVAAGWSVVTVGRDAALDQNPLQWFPEIDHTVYEPDAIHAAVRSALAGKGESPEATAAMLRAAFNPVTDEALEVFA
jgi:hypothetical protein